MTDDLEREARLAEIAGHKARVERLRGQHGTPEHISAPDALAKARAALIPGAWRVTADDVYASIYRDEAAADAYAESNRVHHGHPTLAKIPLEDGRVLGILDLRPALGRAGHEASGEGG